MLRLGIFAALSEVVYDWTFHNTLFYWDVQNIFFTLFIGLAAIALIDRCPAAAKKVLSFFKTTQKNNRLFYLAVYISLILLSIGGALLMVAVGKPAYQYLGLAMILAFYLLRDLIWLLAIAVFAINFFGEGGLQTYACLAIIPIWLYNGQRGFPLKYAFYWFYPAHLLALSALAAAI
jgi:hypothetical protein